MLVIPVANRTYLRRRPLVTFALIGVNTVIFVVGALAPGPRAAERRHHRLIEELRRRPDPEIQRHLAESARRALAARAGLGDYAAQTLGFVPARGIDLRVVSSLFLHGGVVHLLVNMIFLFIFGATVEDHFGRARFLLFYLAAGVASALAHYAFAPQSDIPLIGASGAISGVMAAFVVFHATTRVRLFWWAFVLFGFLEVRALFAIAAWAILQIVQVWRGSAGNIAYLAHLGGFAFGLLVALVVRLVSGPVRRPRVLGPEARSVALVSAQAFAEPWELDAAVARAERELRAGKPSTALSTLEDVLEREPQHLRARQALVHAYFALGRRLDARTLGSHLVAELRAQGRVEEADKLRAFIG